MSLTLLTGSTNWCSATAPGVRRLLCPQQEVPLIMFCNGACCCTRRETESQREQKPDVLVTRPNELIWQLPNKFVWSHRNFALPETSSLFVLLAPLSDMLRGAPCFEQSGLLIVLPLQASRATARHWLRFLSCLLFIRLSRSRTCSRLA